MNVEIKRRIDARTLEGRQAKDKRDLEVELDIAVRRSRLVREALDLRDAMLELVLDAYHRGFRTGSGRAE
jgi:hypothetical protein